MTGMASSLRPHLRLPGFQGSYPPRQEFPAPGSQIPSPIEVPTTKAAPSSAKPALLPLLLEFEGDSAAFVPRHNQYMALREGCIYVHELPSGKLAKTRGPIQSLDMNTKPWFSPDGSRGAFMKGSGGSTSIYFVSTSTSGSLGSMEFTEPSRTPVSWVSFSTDSKAVTVYTPPRRIYVGRQVVHLRDGFVYDFSRGSPQSAWSKGVRTPGVAWCRRVRLLP